MSFSTAGVDLVRQQACVHGSAHHHTYHVIGLAKRQIRFLHYQVCQLDVRRRAAQHQVEEFQAAQAFFHHLPEPKGALPVAVAGMGEIASLDADARPPSADRRYARCAP